MVEELDEGLKHSLINSGLGVVILGSQHIAEGAKAGHRNDHMLVVQELNQARHNVVLQEDDDTFVATLVRDVRHSPADVVQDLLCVRLDKNFRKGRNRALNLIEVCDRLALAKIG